MKNLRPRSHRESVSIIVAPLNSYTRLPGTVRAILEETTEPFELIIIEANAPAVIRHELERLIRGRKKAKIIYSDHRPCLAKAYNLGLTHARGPHLFFMHSGVAPTPGWLEPLIESAVRRDGLVMPYLSGAPHLESDLHVFLASRELLSQIGPFDEQGGTSRMAGDLQKRLSELQKPLLRQPSSILEYRPHGELKGADAELFRRQWLDRNDKDMLQLIDKYRVKSIKGRPAQSFGRPLPSHSPSLAPHFFPKLSLDRFIGVLHKA